MKIHKKNGGQKCNCMHSTGLCLGTILINRNLNQNCVLFPSRFAYAKPTSSLVSLSASSHDDLTMLSIVQVNVQVISLNGNRNLHFLPLTNKTIMYYVPPQLNFRSLPYTRAPRQLANQLSIQITPNTLSTPFYKHNT